MQRYSYETLDGHIIVDTGVQKLLIDTGSPTSIGNAPVQLGGQPIPVAGNYMGLEVSEISAMVGTPFDVLLGMDVLAGTGLFIDPANQQITLNATPAAGGTRMTMSTTMGVPTISCNIGGTYRKLFFDTGATITYLPATAMNGYRPVREVKDFYPGLGTFLSTVYQVPADIGNRQVVIEVGALPDTLQNALLVTGIDGIMGNNAWAGRSVYCSAKDSVLIFDAELIN
jgi:hypothetical protein